MARVITCGCEAVPTPFASAEYYTFEGRQDTDPNGATLDTTVKRSGSASWKFNSTGSNVVVGIRHSFGNFGSGYWLRAYMNFTNMPTANTNLLIFQPSNSADIVTCVLTSAGKVRLWNEIAGSQIGSDSAATLVAGNWYQIELYCKTGAGSVDEAALRLNDIDVASATGLALTDLALYQFRAGLLSAPGANIVMNLDDVALNDDTGASDKSWCGPGKIVYLKPNSDNANPGGWTGGAGGTSNLFAAVDNLPPVGLATGSGTDTSQIKCPTGTNNDYDANMDSYTAAGLVASDDIRLVQPVIIEGYPDSSQISNVLQIVSNPVGSPVTHTWGIGAAIGTYGNNWQTYWGEPIDDPSVVLATQPVLRVGRRGAASIPHICGMFLAVEYNPVVAVNASNTSPIIMGRGAA